MVPLGPDVPVKRSNTFVDRASVFDMIAERVSAGDPFLVLMAEPGFGKTSIAERLVENSLDAAPPIRSLVPGWLHAWHFCQARRYESLDPRAVLQRLASQLCHTVPGYAEEIARSVGDTSIAITQTITGDVSGSTITGVKNLVLPATDPRQLLHDFLRKPLVRMGCPVTVLVDAINESDEQGDSANSLAWLLSTLQDDPVPQLRLVLTTRNGSTAERFRSGHLNLRGIAQAGGTDDVHTYALRCLQDTGVLDAEPLAAEISEAAGGNFLYAVHAIEQYLSDPTSGVLALPASLAELYREYLNRRMAAQVERWHGSIRPTLALLVQSRGEGFTRRQLTAISGLSPSVVDDALERCSPYLLGQFPDGPFAPHHEALREYLRTSPQHSIHPLEATRRIVEVLRGAGTDPHAVTHLLGYLTDYHRLAGGEDTAAALRAIEETITDYTYLHARLSATGIDSLVAEVGTLRRTVGDNDILDAVHGVLTRQAHNLRRWDPDTQPALALGQIRYDCAFSGAPGLIDTSVDEKPALHIEWSAGGEGTWLLSHTLASGEGYLSAMAVSPDSSMVAAARQESGLHVHDVETGAILRSFPLDGHASSVWFSENNRKVLVRWNDGRIIVRNLITGEEEPPMPDDLRAAERRTTPLLPAYINVVRDDERCPFAAATPDGRFAVALCYQSGRQFIAVWDLKRREIIGVHFDNGVTSLAITANGDRVIVGRSIGDPYVLSLPPLPGHASPKGHRAAVQTVALRGDRAVSIDTDGTLKVRNSRSGQPELTVKGPGYTTSIAIHSDGGQCVTGDGEGNIDVFDLGLQLTVRKLAVKGVPVDQLWRTRDGACEPMLPAIGFDEPSPPGQPIRLYIDHRSMVIAVDISTDGRFVVTGTTDGVLRIWNRETGNLHRELTRDGCFIPAARFTSDGRHIVTVSQFGGLYHSRLISVDMWSVASGELTTQLWPPPTESSHDIACNTIIGITRDGRYLATAIDATLVVHDLDDLCELGRLTLHGRITCLAIDDTRALMGTENGEVTAINFCGA
ncbi:WD40 repeat domain-containing protein [Umezawaea sp.]|uniref:WD40 repeat domain-containing protein n=1 Tax=Umezawaea sp. TaxID=1955258 RepID=UPI002ED2EEB7